MVENGVRKNSTLSEIEWIEKQIAFHERELKNYQKMLRTVRGRKKIPENMEKFFEPPE